ncbi:hypothetical protein F4861DRAFT_510352 [Xylaria intraflava]|nr:hypothetical protein F4861DRAFT_510352 [Xylaria intraflava]
MGLTCADGSTESGIRANHHTATVILVRAIITATKSTRDIYKGVFIYNTSLAWLHWVGYGRSFWRIYRAMYFVFSLFVTNSGMGDGAVGLHGAGEASFFYYLLSLLFWGLALQRGVLGDGYVTSRLWNDMMRYLLVSCLLSVVYLRIPYETGLAWTS